MPRNGINNGSRIGKGFGEAKGVVNPLGKRRIITRVPQMIQRN